MQTRGWHLIKSRSPWVTKHWVNTCLIILGETKNRRLIRHQAAHWHHGAPFCVKGPVTLPAISCCSVHTLSPTPAPPVLPPSLLRGAPWPSCISNALWAKKKEKREGTDWEERWRSRKGTEVGMGSAVRPRQQTESIKSVGLLLHWVVINRSWTLSPARRLTG